MAEALSLKLRKILDSSLKKKPVWFKLFLPLFFIVSFCISAIAKIRRKKSYLPPGNLPANGIDVKIICVGNILIGGTGKSPVVQKIAQEFLAKGLMVAIASRGMRVTKKPIYLHPHQKSNNNIASLSDENREHYEILNFNNLSKNLFILQNKNRGESLYYFVEELKKIQGKSEALSHDIRQAVFILDDALQHFSCPRDINICVWQPDLLLNSPHFSMPVGPYREGFGKSSFQDLLSSFNYRLWSRTQNNEFSFFANKIEQSLQKYQLTSCNKDIIACYGLKIIKIQLKNNQYIYSKENPLDILNITAAGIVTGIAHPASFLTDLQKSFTHCTQWSTLFLEDHAGFQKSRSKIIDFINSHAVCIFTLKDFYRWCDEEDFKNSISNKIIFGCMLDLKFYDMEKNPVLLSELF